jgi:hypothetical protein
MSVLSGSVLFSLKMVMELRTHFSAPAFLSLATVFQGRTRVWHSVWICLVCSQELPSEETLSYQDVPVILMLN